MRAFKYRHTIKDKNILNWLCKVGALPDRELIKYLVKNVHYFKLFEKQAETITFTEMGVVSWCVEQEIQGIDFLYNLNVNVDKEFTE